MTLDLAKGLDRDDIDELAYITCMVAKAKLDHTHYHHNMPGKGRAHALKPSQILSVPPVILDPGPWAARLATGDCSDDDVRAARVHNAAPAHAGVQALAELRQRYLRLEDTIGFRIRHHRRTQAARVRSLLGLFSFGFYALLIAGLLFMVILPRPEDTDPAELLTLCLAAVGIAIGLYFQQRITTWDVPVIRLLRTAHGFFTGANPLNRVIEAIKLDATVPEAKVDPFDNLLANIASRLDGEQHRVGMGQNWMAIALGAASLIAGLAALKTVNEPPQTLPPARLFHLTEPWAQPPGGKAPQTCGAIESAA